MKHQLIARNEMEYVDSISENDVNVKKKPYTFLEDDEIERFWKEGLRKNDSIISRGEQGEYYYGDNAFACLFILYTGLRVAEIRGLKWEKVNMDKKIIFTKDTSNFIKRRDKDGQKIKGAQLMEKDKPKTSKSERYLPLPDRAFMILEIMRKKQINEFVFPNRLGNINRTLDEGVNFSVSKTTSNVWK